MSKKILIGVDAIRNYLPRADGAPVSWATVKKHIRRGMPAKYVDGGWIAHADHIDTYFLKLTFNVADSVPDEESDPEE